jgi:hypothetical protein
MATPADQEKKPEDPKGDLLDAYKEVNYIFGGPNSYGPKRKQNLIGREVLVGSPATPEYRRWSEVPITFYRGDHLDFIPKLGRYPLVVCPIVKTSSSTECWWMEVAPSTSFFLKTFNQVGCLDLCCVLVGSLLGYSPWDSSNAHWLDHSSRKFRDLGEHLKQK